MLDIKSEDPIHTNLQQVPANSDAGASIAAKNALSHGVYAKEIVLSGENSEDFESLHASLCREFNPDGELESDTVTEIVQALWVKRRLVRAYRSSCEKASVASVLMDAKNGGSSECEQDAQPKLEGALNKQPAFYGSYKEQKVYLNLLKKLYAADGVDVAKIDHSSPFDASPSAREFIGLVGQLCYSANSNESAFEQFCRPSDLERFLKILGTLDTRIEKAIARLAGFKEYKRQYGKNVLQG